ncbi:MAG: heparinase II/III family protein [Fimbriimonadaceae bacterium]|nr:heparinase II/III family protein [Fimbriimonadaceae bacterium]
MTATLAALLLLAPMPHPNLFYDAGDIARMKARLDRFEWAREAFASVQQTADAWVNTTAEPPLQQGGWSHDYACPADGARLTFRLDSPHRHRCPACGQEWEGPTFDATWVSHRHGDFLDAARNLALTWQIGGERRYGLAAARIVDWYAQHYAEFPEGRGPVGKGRVQSQSLTEASWLIGILDAADLAWDCFTPAQQQRLEQQLLRPGEAQCWKYYQGGIHNITCWHNAMSSCVGYFLGDPALIAKGRAGKIGLEQQLAQGVLPDGMWFERSLGYHNYTLSALSSHVEAARRHGDPLHQDPRLLRMVTLPLRLAFPNLVAPSLNDMGYSNGLPAAAPLERALAWTGDPQLAAALRLLYASGVKRGGQVTWQYGEDLPAGDAWQPPGSENLSGTGLAVLRQGQGAAALCAMLEYGEHGGGHGHPDKLQLLLYGHGQVLLPDPGTAGYGSPIHSEWFKTTAAHNTVVVNHASQKATTGKLRHFDPAAGRAVAVSDAAYPGFHLERAVQLLPDGLQDDFTVSGQTVVDLDWFARAPGKLTVNLPLEPLSEQPANKTYARLADLRGALSDQPIVATWTLAKPAGARLEVTMRAEPGTQVAVARAPGVPGQAWDTLRLRRTTAATVFSATWRRLPAAP